MDKKSFYLFCLAFLSTSFGLSVLSPLIPQMAYTFNIEALHMAHISWFYMLPYGVAALLWAPLTRVLTIKEIFIANCFGFSFCSLLFSVASTYQMAFATQFLTGVFNSSFMPLALITIGKEVPAKDRGKYLGILFGLSYLSALVGVTLSGFILWRQVYWVPTALGLVAFLLAFKHMKEFDYRGQGFKFSYFQTLADKKALILCLFIFFASFFYHSIQQLLGVYLSKTYALKQIVLSSIFMVATFCAVIFQFSGGRITRRFKNTHVAAVGFFAMALFMVAMIFNHVYQLMFLLMILWGGGWALNHLGLSAYLTHLPDKILRDASSLNSSIRFVSGGLGVMVANSVIVNFGFKIQFLFVAVATIVMGLFVNRALKN